jgi:putative transposase
MLSKTDFPLNSHRFAKSPMARTRQTKESPFKRPRRKPTYSTAFFREEQLRALAQERIRGVPLSQLKTRITDVYGVPIITSKRTVLRYWQEHGMIPVHVPRNHAVPDALIDFIGAEYEKAPVGMYRMYFMAYIARAEGKLDSEVSYDMIRDAHALLSFTQPARPPPVEIYRCRYVARQANLIWHTDLHDHCYQGGEKRKLIAFLDDASRMIMGFRFLPNKSSQLTSEALKEVIRDAGCAPYCLWSDCGGEFKKKFLAVMKEFGIADKHTTPYTPEQNGKIERWWPTSDESSAENLAVAVQAYNERPHNALPRFDIGLPVHPFLSPLAQYNLLEKRGPGQTGEWIVDGVLKPFA